MPDGDVDLHMHTVASDGTSTVRDRVARADRLDLDAIAITDHDRIHEDLVEPVERRRGVEVVTGVEIRADLDGRKVEILGYFVDPASSALSDVLERARGFRRERNRAIVERLRTEVDFDRTYEGLRRETDGGLGRPHIADALVEDGIVPDIGAAFEELLGEDGDAYVPMERVPHETVIDAIHDAGGVASLAHPGRIRASADWVRDAVASLADAGLDAIEVWYPYGGTVGEYADVDVDDADRIAESHGLMKTGGSDCHGPDSGKDRMGEVTAPERAYARLRGRADSV